jgi:hypothetical protein
MRCPDAYRYHALTIDRFATTKNAGSFSMRLWANRLVHIPQHAIA